jgi:hypothetical protein
MSAFTFKKAERHAVKLKIAVDGPSGSGKTMGALALAKGITNGGRIALADSENVSASLYAGRFEFDTIAIPDAKPSTYKALIDAAVEGGYEALVIDSLSHAWHYVLAEKEAHELRDSKANGWTLWRKYGPMWDGLMQHILQAPIHIIATMRSKQAYEQVVKSDGRKAVVKLGMAPQVRDGSEYEFSIVFSVNQDHFAEATKDRSELFAGRQLNLCDVALHRELAAWMDSGGPAPAAAPGDRIVKGRRISDYPTPELEAMLTALEASTDPRHVPIAADVKSVILARANDVDGKVARMQEAEDKHQAGLKLG